jgi:hypothetical protein
MDVRAQAQQSAIGVYLKGVCFFMEGLIGSYVTIHKDRYIHARSGAASALACVRAHFVSRIEAGICFPSVGLAHQVPDDTHTAPCEGGRTSIYIIQGGRVCGKTYVGLLGLALTHKLKVKPKQLNDLGLLTEALNSRGFVVVHVEDRH